MKGKRLSSQARKGSSPTLPKPRGPWVVLPLPSLTTSAYMALGSIGPPVPEYIPTYAIIPTNGRECFYDCLNTVTKQVDRVYVVEGGPGAKLTDAGPGYGLDFSVVREPEINISRWWNLGLSLIADRVRGQVNKWNVAIINDDAIIHQDWVAEVGRHMRDMGAAAASSGNPYPVRALHTQPGPVDLSTRLQGFAFMLAGEKGVRANEQLKWYFSDDHVDWLSRQQGGVLSIPGYPVKHLYPNGQVTPELQEQIAKDAEAFSAYWGGLRPW